MSPGASSDVVPPPVVPPPVVPPPVEPPFVEPLLPVMSSLVEDVVPPVEAVVPSAVVPLELSLLEPPVAAKLTPTPRITNPSNMRMKNLPNRFIALPPNGLVNVSVHRLGGRGFSAPPAKVKVSRTEGKDSSKRTSAQSSLPDPCPLEPLPDPLPLESSLPLLPCPLESSVLPELLGVEDDAARVHFGSFLCSGSLQRSADERVSLLSFVARGCVDALPTEAIDSAAGTDASVWPAVR
jgi:hypothetical protein